MTKGLTDHATPLVLAFTPNYVVPAATCLSSILQHSDKSAHFEVICLLTEELPGGMKAALAELGEGRLHFTYLNMQGKLADIYVDERYTVAASYRLLLPDLLPEYDQVLYVDCDIIVRNDLAKLYRETMLGDHYLAAVFEAPLDEQLSYLQQLGIQPGRYFNSGFLLMNLQKLRADGMVAKFLEAAKTPGLQFPDQDVLNQLCQGKVRGLAPQYNSIRTFYLPQYKANFMRYYSEADWQTVWKQGNVHYTGGKPWNTFTVQFERWWQYYERLPEAVKQLGERNNKMWNLYRMSSTLVGKSLVGQAQGIFRRLKYGKGGQG